MKNYYIQRIVMLVTLTIFSLISSQAQVRIFKLDPATNTVTLKNYGSANSPISGLWFCNFPDYAQVNGMTSVTSLDPDEEVVINSTINFDVADGEFGLYNTNSFGSSSAMEDYLQWGSADHQREPVAVAAGLWDAGTFLDVAPPFEYTGNGTQNGVAFWSSESQPKLRIFRLNPATNSVTLKNFGDAEGTISGLWFCNFPDYAQVNGMTSVTSLAPDEEVVIISTINFDEVDGEFGLYNTNNFGSSSAMEDYLQWGSADHQREPVAVAAGLWDAGTFINVAPPFEYIGDGTQNGAAFWDSTLSLEDFEQLGSLKLFPNPTTDTLTIKFSTVISNDMTVEVFNLLGKRVHQSNLITQSEILDVSNWSSGIYILKVSSEGSSSSHRLIKR